MSFIINPNSFSWQWVKKKQCKIATALMDLILPNTDNMIFNTSCMHSISLVVDISFCVSGLAHLHMPLRPPLVSIQELPITLYKLVRRRFGGRNENSREENNILSMCAFAVFSILIIFTVGGIFFCMIFPLFGMKRVKKTVTFYLISPNVLLKCQSENGKEIHATMKESLNSFI